MRGIIIVGAALALSAPSAQAGWKVDRVAKRIPQSQVVVRSLNVAHSVVARYGAACAGRERVGVLPDDTLLTRAVEQRTGTRWPHTGANGAALTTECLALAVQSPEDPIRLCGTIVHEVVHLHGWMHSVGANESSAEASADRGFRAACRIEFRAAEVVLHRLAVLKGRPIRLRCKPAGSRAARRWKATLESYKLGPACRAGGGRLFAFTSGLTEWDEGTTGRDARGWVFG